MLNVAPGPDGEWHEEAYKRLEEIGAWMKMNGEAIYGTTGDHIIGNQGQWVFTHKGKTTYAIYQATENETTMPKELTISNWKGSTKIAVTMLGSSKKVKYKISGNTLTFSIPEELHQHPPCGSAWVFKMN